MEITTRGLLTLIHGMGFGALYLIACSGALVELHRRYWLAAQARDRSRGRKLPWHLPHRHGRAGMDHRAHRRLRHLSLVPRRAACGNRRPRRLSAAPAHVQPLHHRLALHRHGMEGARRLARAHLHHHGRRSLRPPWPQSQSPARTSHRGPRFRVGLASRSGHRRLLRRHAQQERARPGRLNHSHRRRENEK